MRRLLEKTLGFTKILEDNLLVKQDLLVHFVKADAITRKFRLKEINIGFLSLQNCSNSFLLIQLGDANKFALFTYDDVKELFRKSTNGKSFLEFSFTIIPSICEDCSTVAVIKNIDDIEERQQIAQVPILEKLDVALILGDYLCLTA